MWVLSYGYRCWNGRKPWWLWMIGSRESMIAGLPLLCSKPHISTSFVAAYLTKFYMLIPMASSILSTSGKRQECEIAKKGAPSNFKRARLLTRHVQIWRPVELLWCILPIKMMLKFTLPMSLAVISWRITPSLSARTSWVLEACILLDVGTLYYITAMLSN